MADVSTPQSIDITDLVEKARSSFVTWGVAYIFGAEVAIPGLEWVADPIISTIDKELIRIVLNAISSSIVMEAFFLNTVVKKASQAQDYVDAVNAKLNLPPSATEAEVLKAEQNEVAAFRNFVVLTS